MSEDFAPREKGLLTEGGETDEAVVVDGSLGNLDDQEEIVDRLGKIVKSILTKWRNFLDFNTGRGWASQYPNFDRLWSRDYVLERGIVLNIANYGSHDFGDGNKVPNLSVRVILPEELQFSIPDLKDHLEAKVRDGSGIVSSLSICSYSHNPDGSVDRFRSSYRFSKGGEVISGEQIDGIRGAMLGKFQDALASGGIISYETAKD